MSKLFISYRRKSWGFTHRLADELRERLDAEVFVDVDSIDQTDFENAIVNHLRQSDVVLLVVSETTFIDRIHRDDDWVRREIREALTLKIPLVMVCVEGLLPPSGMPDDIRDIARMQGVNFYPEYFPSAVERLVDFVIRVSLIERKGTLHGSGTAQAISTSHGRAVVGNLTGNEINSKASLDEALDLLEKGDFSKAIFLLEGLRDSGFKSRFVNIDEILQDAQMQHQQVERRRIAQIEYDEIAGFVKRRITHDRGIVAFDQWQQEYPDLVPELDTENIRSQSSAITAPPVIRRSKSLAVMPNPFDWIDIPAGKLMLSENDGANGGDIKKATTFDMAAFSIAKYPLTNAQFRVFWEAGGYKEKKWWPEAGWQVREKAGWSEPHYWQDAQWNKPDHPVVGVSWYEAIAFCRWLSKLTGEKINLPTYQRWQRAAQGDTGWAYPYGNTFDEKRCNFGQQGTTVVTQFEGQDKGDSPFGVVDMSGNVWEWCLTKIEVVDDKPDETDFHVLRGDSWGRFSTDLLRVDYLFGNAANSRGSFWGFRIARN